MTSQLALQYSCQVACLASRTTKVRDLTRFQSRHLHIEFPYGKWMPFSQILGSNYFSIHCSMYITVTKMHGPWELLWMGRWFQDTQDTHPFPKQPSEQKTKQTWERGETVVHMNALTQRGTVWGCTVRVSFTRCQWLKKVAQVLLNDDSKCPIRGIHFKQSGTPTLHSRRRWESLGTGMEIQTCIVKGKYKS